MEQFNLDTWLQDKSRKICTRDGRPVRIICTDRKGKSGNIVGLVGKDESLIYVWNNDGKHIVSEIPDNDLFFADEEEKPQSIEIPFGAFDSEFIKDEYYIPEGCEARIEGNKVIIERVQKEDELTEFEKEVDAIIDENIKRNIGLKYEARNLLDLAREEISKDNVIITLSEWKTLAEKFKDLPKWKKITDETNLSLTLSNGEYYLPLEDLENLPKEE